MKTTLYPEHLALKAKMVDFGGWQMPLHYPSGIVSEHMAVRNKVGIFDVSHMGRIEIKGPDAEVFLDSLSTNRMIGKEAGSATYTVLSNQEGGSIDDVIICKEDHDRFFLIANASNKQKDLSHLKASVNDYRVKIYPCYDEEGILALQGPEALSLAEELFPELASLKKMHFIKAHYQHNPFFIGRTGYTGSDGIEIFAKNPLIQTFWHYFIGKGVLPIGLGARDTLRQEMGYALYGHELADNISAIESVSFWTVKFEEHDFIGKEKMETLLKEPNRRRQYGILMQEGRIPRQGCPIFSEGTPCGFVTSGTFSPLLNLPIALVMAEKHLKDGDEITIALGDKNLFGKVVPLPFLTPKRMQ